MDEFIDALIFGKGGSPVADIVGTSNARHLGDAVTKAYQTYMAQAVSLNMRSAQGLGKRAIEIAGTMRVPGHQRLVQNAKHKIALQVMLGIMVLCLAVARPLMRVGKVLAHNPCTIAGIAALLADSTFATDKEITAGSEWLSDDEIQNARLFAGVDVFAAMVEG